MRQCVCNNSTTSLRTWRGNKLMRGADIKKGGNEGDVPRKETTGDS